MEASGLQNNEIDEILMVGGSTRIPCVRAKIQEYFEGRELNYSQNPDEAVALGAAILGKMIARGEEIMFKDVTSLAFGVEAYDPNTNSTTLDAIIPRNTQYPFSNTVEYRTVKDN